MDNVDRVKSICKDRKIPISKLEKECGFSNGYVRSLRNGTFPADRLNIIASYLGLSVDYLLTGQENAQPRRGVKIPVVAYVAAGLPIEAIENVIDWEEITEEMARRGTFFGLKIKGDSMEPFINDGDVVIVRKQPDADKGDIVVALVNGNEGVCKKLTKYSGGITLESINTKYSPMSFTNQQIGDYPVTIAGKVVEIRRKL